MDNGSCQMQRNSGISCLRINKFVMEWNMNNERSVDCVLIYSKVAPIHWTKDADISFRHLDDLSTPLACQSIYCFAMCKTKYKTKFNTCKCKLISSALFFSCMVFFSFSVVSSVVVRRSACVLLVCATTLFVCCNGARLKLSFMQINIWKCAALLRPTVFFFIHFVFIHAVIGQLWTHILCAMKM